MRNPLRLGHPRAPEIAGQPRPLLPVTHKTRRIAALSTACAVVVGVGAGSALFVDYLADRALARAADTAPVKPVREVRVAFDSSIVSDASPAGDAPPVVRPPEIITVPPVAATQPPSADPSTPEIDAVETAALDPDAGDTSKVMPDMPDDAVEDESTSAGPEQPPAASSGTDEQKRSASLPSEPSEDELSTLPGVEVGGLTGKASGPARSARIIKAVNMRARGQKGAKVLTVLPAGTAVSLYGCDSWCEVSYKGRKGFVYKSFVGSAQPAQKAAAAEQASAEEADEGSSRFVVKSQRGGDR